MMFWLEGPDVAPRKAPLWAFLDRVIHVIHDARFVFLGDLQEMVPYLVIITGRKLLDPRDLGYRLYGFRRSGYRYLQYETTGKRYEFVCFEAGSALTDVPGRRTDRGLAYAS